jgi:hypothetical protein
VVVVVVVGGVILTLAREGKSVVGCLSRWCVVLLCVVVLCLLLWDSRGFTRRRLRAL